MMSLREIARALGGEVSGHEVLAPGPGHSSHDRSMWTRLSATAPDGFLCGSFAGDDWRKCKDYVRDRLGLGGFGARSERRCGSTAQSPSSSVENRRRDAALRIWNEAKDPRGTIVQSYLRSRGLDLPADIAGEAIRFHRACPWREGETAIRVPAMLAVIRSIEDDQIVGVHRTRLSLDGRKVDRRMLGVAAGAAIKLDANDAVTMGLAIGEGIETVLAGRQMGLGPAWALGSAGAIATFPVLAGIEALTIFAENDPASATSVRACGLRWKDARREVIVAQPRPGFGNDLNDAIRGYGAA